MPESLGHSRVLIVFLLQNHGWPKQFSSQVQVVAGAAGLGTRGLVLTLDEVGAHGPHGYDWLHLPDGFLFHVGAECRQCPPRRT